MRGARVATVAVLLALSAGCSGQEVGRLAPQSGPGIAIVATAHAGHAAEVADGTLTARVGGTWASQDLQSIDITYRNAAAAPVTLPVDGIGLTLGGEAAVLDTVDDVTGVDVSRPGNTATPRPLLAANGAASPLVVPAGAARTLLARFVNFKRPGNRAAKGKTMTVTIPLAGGVRRLSFRCAD